MRDTDSSPGTTRHVPRTCTYQAPLLLSRQVLQRPLLLPDSALGEVPGAVIRTTVDCALTADDWQAWCAERMAAYKIPAQWCFTDSALPRNAVNKLLKQAIRDEFF